MLTLYAHEMGAPKLTTFINVESYSNGAFVTSKHVPWFYMHVALDDEEKGGAVTVKSACISKTLDTAPDFLVTREGRMVDVRAPRTHPGFHLRFSAATSDARREFMQCLGVRGSYSSTPSLSPQMEPVAKTSTSSSSPIEPLSLAKYW